MSAEEIKGGLKKSKDTVGYLYPILVKKGTMEIIDGVTRKQSDPTWPEKEVEVQDKKHEIMIRMHANYRRQVSRKETQTQLLMLADILEKEGVPRKQIASKLAELTPYSLSWIEVLLPKKYKEAKFAPKKVQALGPTKTVTETKPGAEPEEPKSQERRKPLLCPVCATKLELRGDILFPV